MFTGPSYRPHSMQDAALSSPPNSMQPPTPQMQNMQISGGMPPVGACAQI